MRLVFRLPGQRRGCAPAAWPSTDSGASAMPTTRAPPDLRNSRREESWRAGGHDTAPCATRMHRAHDPVVRAAAAEVAVQRALRSPPRSASGVRASSAWAAITMPLPQKPHWQACSWMNARCSALGSLGRAETLDRRDPALGRDRDRQDARALLAAVDEHADRRRTAPARSRTWRRSARDRSAGHRGAGCRVRR